MTRSIVTRNHLELLDKDQCCREMRRGSIFHGLTEGPITFYPTYKFEKGWPWVEGESSYDQSEKRRVPGMGATGARGIWRCLSVYVSGA